MKTQFNKEGTIAALQLMKTMMEQIQELKEQIDISFKMEEEGIKPANKITIAERKIQIDLLESNIETLTIEIEEQTFPL